MSGIIELTGKLQVELDQDEFQIGKFESYLAQLQALRSSKIVQPLLSVFRDDFQYDEALFSIVHLLEALESEEYIRELVAGLHVLERASTEWLGLLVHRICNDEESYQIFLSHAVSTSEPKVLRALETTVRELKDKFPTRSGDRLETDLGLPGIKAH